jgi:uncharacterized protein (TIGR02118 family)
MVKVRILYPNKPGSRFDAAYYLDTHVPMAMACLARGVIATSVDIGVAGAQPQPFAAMCHFVCESVDAFFAALTPHAEKLRGDIATYTDIEPVVQISEMMIAP